MESDMKHTLSKNILSKPIWLYELIYYRLYQWSEKLEGKSTDVHVSAAILFSFIQMQNILLIVVLLLSSGATALNFMDKLNAISCFVFGVGLCGINLIFVLTNNRYRDIIKKFSKDSSQMHRSKIIDASIISSFCLTISLMLLATLSV